MISDESIYSGMSDQQLFLCISHDDEAAFAYAYFKHIPVVYAFCLRYLRNDQDVEDAVRQVFLRLWEKRHEITIRESLKDYLYIATKNHVLNILRHQLSAKLKSGAMPSSAAQTSVEDEYLRVETEKQLEFATLALSPVKQQIVNLRRQGFSNKEISRLLQMPENTVKTYYAQSLKHFREYFKRIVFFGISFFSSLVSL